MDEWQLTWKDKKMIPVFRPSYDEEELESLRGPLRTGWVGLGPKTREFEEKFAKYIGVKYAVGCNSCTAALHLALKVMNVEGAEVITTPMTFVSTNHAILYNNATPVFCDIEEDTLNIDATKIEKLITDKTRAIMAVHYGGHACDMDRILGIAQKYDLKVIEDCAHAAGGEYKDKKLGSIGDISCFSFHAVKNLAMGEGGAVLINSDLLSERLKKLRWLGISKGTWDRSKTEEYSWSYNVEEIGYKYHLNDIHASIGLVQLRKLNKLNQRRREIVGRYNESFNGLSWLQIPVEKEYTKSSLHNYVAKVEKRDDFIEYMAENGIAIGVHYVPNHLYKMYKPYYRKLPVAETVWKKLATLPLFPDLSNEDIEKIINTVNKFAKRTS